MVNLSCFMFSFIQGRDCYITFGWVPSIASLIILLKLLLSLVIFSNVIIICSGLSLERFSRTLVAFRSVSICFSHVNAGRPTGLHIGVRYSFSTTRAGVFSSNLITCPSQFSVRLQMVLDQDSAFVLLYTSSFVIILGHLT